MGQATDSTHIRWLIRRDMPGVMAIENGSFDFPWEEAEFADCLKSRSVIGLVCEREDTVVGFIVYELAKGMLYVVNMAVHPAFRHEGVGSQMLKKLFGKLCEKRPDIVIDVREENLECQLFLKANDFNCREILKDHYDNGESAYRFRYNLFGLDE